MTSQYSRRHIVAGLALAGLAPGLAPGIGIAAPLAPTPRQSEGPFYPNDDAKPGDRDWDLVELNGQAIDTEADILDLSGRVLTPDGEPVADALVEIWQADDKGGYNHPRDGGNDRFQGYGAVRTDAAGEYRFRTIKPAAYGSFAFERTPHIHMKVRGAGIRPLTTQMYFAGEALNEHDGIRNRLSPAERERVTVAFGGKDEAGARPGRFDIVVKPAAA